MNVIEIILWGFLAVVIIAAICNLIRVFRVLRLEQSTPTYRIDPIRPIVTTYTFEDGTKVYDTGDGKIEIEHPDQEESE